MTEKKSCRCDLEYCHGQKCFPYSPSLLLDMHSVGQPLSQLLTHSSFHPLSRQKQCQAMQKKKKNRMVIAENITDHS